MELDLIKFEDPEIICLRESPPPKQEVDKFCFGDIPRRSCSLFVADSETTKLKKSKK